MLQADERIISTITRATSQSVTHTIVLKKKTKMVRGKRACKRCYIRISKKAEAQWRKRR